MAVQCSSHKLTLCASFADLYPVPYYQSSGSFTSTSRNQPIEPENARPDFLSYHLPTTIGRQFESYLSWGCRSQRDVWLSTMHLHVIGSDSAAQPSPRNGLPGSKPRPLGTVSGVGYARQGRRMCLASLGCLRTPTFALAGYRTRILHLIEPFG